MNQHYLAPGRKYEVISCAFKRRKKESKTLSVTRGCLPEPEIVLLPNASFPQARKSQSCLGDRVELHCFNKVLWNFINVKDCKCLQFWSCEHPHSAVLDFNEVVKNISHVIHVAILLAYNRV